MCRYTGLVPFTPADIAFVFSHPRLSFARGFSNIGIIGVGFTVTVEFINELNGLELGLIFAVENILKTGTRFEYD